MQQMTISFSKIALPKAGAMVLLVGKDGALPPLGRKADEASSGQLGKAMKVTGFAGKQNEFVDLPAPTGLAVSRVVIAGIGEPGELGEFEAERLGGSLAAKLLDGADSSAAIVAETIADLKIAPEILAARLASGVRLRDYRFDRYVTKKKNGDPKLKSVAVQAAAPARAQAAFRGLDAVANGVHLARDLVNEPANILFPAEFARRAQGLSKLGVKVEVLAPKQIEKLGMHALLGVGHGSDHESRVVVMQWSGGRSGSKPLAFIGKGVTFDTGGISIKPAASMGDMKGDMGGAACVVGLMHALAARKAKVNAVGVIGLVENMPDAAAQRPGDIVTSMSGQTIEVLNTDAEGRLVLADILWYAQKRFKPEFMINLATLTGAILVALGQEYAGMFTNNDELADGLFAAGSATGEKVWRMPLAPEYDKMIDTPNADMKNIGNGRNAGAITAAQFLQRFVNDFPWAHLDIAGTAMNSPKSPINPSWGSGYGVRLLNQLVVDRYEK
jgi:leucyl aminopeptidase